MRAYTNVVVCMADQMRPFELACYGGSALRTPHIDKLAEGGVVWDTAITNYPVCLPARSVLISGQHYRTATGGVANIKFETASNRIFMPQYPQLGRPHLVNTTLPESLGSVGYYCQAIGKWHIHSWPHEVGFDAYTIPHVQHANSAQIYSRNGGPEFSPPGFNVEFETREVENFLRNHPQGRPFFLYYNISPPHGPIADIPDEFLHMHGPEDVRLRENVNEDEIIDRDHWYKVYRWDYRYYNYRLPHTLTLPSGYDIRHLTAEYYGAVSWMDTAVGNLMASLEQTDLLDKTLVLFLSDHGDNLGSHGLMQKGMPNDESLRIPLIMSGPTLTAGTKVRGSVASIVDIFPTLMEAAGLPVPPHCHGQSLLSMARGRESDGRSAFFETPDYSGLRTPNTTFAVVRDKDRQLQASPSIVFDNQADPFQNKNLCKTADRDRLYQRLAELDQELPWLHQGSTA